MTEITTLTSANDAVAADAPAAGVSCQPPTLVEAQPRLEAVQAASRALAGGLRSLLDGALQALVECEPELSEQLLEADRLSQDMDEAFLARYGVGAQLDPKGRRPLVCDSTEDWNDQAERVLTAMSVARVPLFAGKRFRQQSSFRDLLSSLKAGRPLAEHRTLQVAFREFSGTARDAAAREFERGLPELHAILEAGGSEPPVLGALEAELDDRLRPGAGRLLLRVGWARVAPLRLTLYTPGDAVGLVAANVEELLSPSFEMPLLLDLDRDGGLVTDAPASVNNTILKLLAVLPAGQVKATVFDPARLGESAKFLFGLGDAAESIIGTKVKTTERELADALIELEEHITFVTQKYLQGTFDSLTAYDIAAGEVAEPYRLLVLYDFPKGFVRATGGLDEEALMRLGKIAKVGRRCGVFTLVVTSPSTPEEALAPLAGLPSLWRARAPHLSWVARLATGADSVGDFQLEIGRMPASGSGQIAAARVPGTRIFTGRACSEWLYRPEDQAPDAAVAGVLARVERGIALAGDVRVSLEHVAELARAKLARDVARGTREQEVLPLPSDPATWWHGSSSRGVSAAFGRVGASDVGVLALDSRSASGAVIGGRPGAGKSVLIHAMIASLVTRYAPSELALYLVDFKEGVEFKAYAAGGLPHARVVAIESDREFGLSVLQSLDEEMSRRGEAFRAGAGEEVNLETFRARTGESLARIVLVIDEFHMLFERDDKIATGAAELLDRIVRQGRAFGVHAVLASQTLAGTVALGRHTLNQLPIRIALQCSDADSRLLLADDNADARLLTRPGEGIFNVSEGLREANVRFQAAFLPPDERAAMVSELRVLAERRGIDARPVVFEGNATVEVDVLSTQALRGSCDGTRVALPVGLPLTLGGPVVAELRREPGGNLLVIADDDSALSVLTVAATALTATAAKLDVLDYGALDAPWAGCMEILQANGVRVARRREASARLTELRALVAQRTELSDHSAPAHVCMISALHRARELDANAASDETECLEAILRDGPDVGVHVVAWCDKPVSLQRRLSSDAQREFALRLVGPMSREDSFALVDSDLAASLGPAQAVLDDHDRAQTTRLRRFRLPLASWVSEILTG